MTTCLVSSLKVPTFSQFVLQERKARATVNTRPGTLVVQAMKKSDGKSMGQEEKPSRIQLKRPKRDLTSTMAAKEEQAGRVLNACLNAVGTMDLEAMDLCLQMANEIRDADQREGAKK
eukprot:TRINITY_DN2036_c0_g2_i1.p1 TRINITY_DN2036_c0_g2~~TRINITY_DN2036_c0_g2_i1.p1  ORF type:complete len:118 (-),score=32.07 TRINITY_DN2036_c0_g2_i1:479-832(-)